MILIPRVAIATTNFQRESFRLRCCEHQYQRKFYEFDALTSTRCEHLNIDARILLHACAIRCIQAAHSSPVHLHVSIPGLISPANAREICQRLQISNVSNDGVNRHQCMMGNSQSAVARYSIMYQDWGLSVPQK